MHTFARDPANRILIKNHKLIPIFVQLLYSDIENIQRVTAGVLCELAVDKEVVATIEQEGGTVPLAELANSPNEAVSTYANAVLNHMSDGKPEDFYKRLSADRYTRMLRGDVEMNEWNNDLGFGQDLSVSIFIFKN